MCEYSGVGQWECEAEWGCAGYELLYADGSGYPVQLVQKLYWVYDSWAGVEDVGEEGACEGFCVNGWLGMGRKGCALGLVALGW